LNARHGNAPTLRHLLAATTRNPGKVELAGYAVGRAATMNASPPTGCTCSPTPPRIRSGATEREGGAVDLGLAMSHKYQAYDVLH
jgi:hypothetical protein